MTETGCAPLVVGVEAGGSDELASARTSDDLTNVLNSVGIAILLLSRDTRIRRFTPAAAHLFNLIAADVGRPISDLKSNLRAPGLATLVQKAVEQLLPREEIVTDDRGHWYQLTLRPYLTTDGRIDGAVITIVDVDGLQRGHATLAEARDYTECIVDTVRQPLLVLDEQRTIRSVNRSFQNVFQIDQTKALGERFDQLGKPPWARSELMKTVDRLMALAPAPLPLPLPLPDSERNEDIATEFGGRAVLVSVRPLVRGDRAPWLLLAFDDLTEQRKADAAVRRSERRLRDMLSAASEAILIAGGDGPILYANAKAEETFGYTSLEMFGLSIESLVPEGHREVPAVPDIEGFESKGVPHVPGLKQEMLCLRKDGSRFPAEVGLSTMDGDSGPLLVAFVTDVSARKEAETRIRAHRESLQKVVFESAVAEERERRNLATVLHDNVSQTLALAQIRLQAAERALAGPARSDLSAGIALIAQALADTRELTFELSPPILYDLGLPAAVSWLGEKLEAHHGLHVTVNAADPFAKLADETASILFRGVRELLTNVVKHAKTTAAAVTLTREQKSVRLEVEDQGQGFVVGPYPCAGANGFGLFSVREQVIRLGGEVFVNSSPGYGTTISIAVPIDASRVNP